MDRVRIGLGTFSCLFGGMLIGDMLAGNGAVLGWAGGLVLLTGVGLITSAVRRRGRGHGTAISSRQSLSAALPELSAPLLGELLVGRAMISRLDLSKALASQQGTSKHLGEILVEMGLITAEELTRVVEEQHVYRQRGFTWRG